MRTEPFTVTWKIKAHEVPYEPGQLIEVEKRVCRILRVDISPDLTKQVEVRDVIYTVECLGDPALGPAKTRYTVHLETTRVQVYNVDADSEEEAIAKAEHLRAFKEPDEVIKGASRVRAYERSEP